MTYTTKTMSHKQTYKSTQKHSFYRAINLFTGLLTFTYRNTNTCLHNF